MSNDKFTDILKGKGIIIGVIIAIIIVIAIALIFSSTPDESKKVTSEKPLVTIKESYIGSSGKGSGSMVGNINIADKLGYLKEEGIVLQDVGDLPDTAGAALAALKAGEIDVNAANLPSGVTAIGAGADFIYIAPAMSTVSKKPDGNLTSAGGLIALKSNGYKTPSDFIGKTWSVGKGSSGDYFTQKWFLDNGLTLEDFKKVTSITVPSGSAIQSLKSHQIDAAYLQSSAFYLALEDPELYKVFEARDIVGERMQTGYLVRKEWVKNNPEAAAGFVRAITKAWAWAYDHNEDIQDLAAEIIKDHNQDPALNKYVYAWQRPDGLWKDEDVTFWIERLTKAGVLKKNLTPADIYTNEFNPNFKAKS